MDHATHLGGEVLPEALVFIVGAVEDDCEFDFTWVVGDEAGDALLAHSEVVDGWHCKADLWPLGKLAIADDGNDEPAHWVETFVESTGEFGFLGEESDLAIWEVLLNQFGKLFSGPFDGVIWVAWLVAEFGVWIVQKAVWGADYDSSGARLDCFEELLGIRKVFNRLKGDDHVGLTVIVLAYVAGDKASARVDGASIRSCFFGDINAGCALGEERGVVGSVALTACRVDDFCILVPGAEKEIPLEVRCLGCVVAHERNHAFAGPSQCR